jgi:hypothetical protein
MKTTIDMALESKVVPVLLTPHGEYFTFLERFAELVRADAIAHEREACARVCLTEWSTLGQMEAGEAFARAIRARGNT